MRKGRSVFTLHDKPVFIRQSQRMLHLKKKGDNYKFSTFLLQELVYVINQAEYASKQKVIFRGNLHLYKLRKHSISSKKVWKSKEQQTDITVYCLYESCMNHSPLNSFLEIPRFLILRVHYCRKSVFIINNNYMGNSLLTLQSSQMTLVIFKTLAGRRFQFQSLCFAFQVTSRPNLIFSLQC